MNRGEVKENREQENECVGSEKGGRRGSGGKGSNLAGLITFMFEVAGEISIFVTALLK